MRVARYIHICIFTYTIYMMRMYSVKHENLAVTRNAHVPIQKEISTKLYM